MNIVVYTICWNESEMLRLFLRHYSQFADRIVVYDNHSTDDSMEIARSNPLCEVRTIGGSEFDERDLLWVKGSSWKESRDQADWVISCDIDEFLFHSDVRHYLDVCKHQGVTFPKTNGYELVAERFPTGDRQLYQMVRRGFARELYSKRIVFAPGSIDDINYAPGCHQASPTGNVVEDVTCQFKMLHAGSVGRKRVVQRRLAMRERLSTFNTSNGFCKHIELSPAEMNCQFDGYCRLAGHLWFLGAGGASMLDYLQMAKRNTKRLLGIAAAEPCI